MIFIKAIFFSLNYFNSLFRNHPQTCCHSNGLFLSDIPGSWLSLLPKLTEQEEGIDHILLPTGQTVQLLFLLSTLAEHAETCKVIPHMACGMFLLCLHRVSLGSVRRVRVLFCSMMIISVQISPGKLMKWYSILTNIFPQDTFCILCVGGCIALLFLNCRGISLICRKNFNISLIFSCFPNICGTHAIVKN